MLRQSVHIDPKFDVLTQMWAQVKTQTAHDGYYLVCACGVRLDRVCMWCEVGYGVQKRRGQEDHTPVHYRSPEKNTYRETPQDHQTVSVCMCV